MRRVFVLLGVVALLAALTAPAVAGATVNVSVPFDMTMTSPCNGHEIKLSGTEHDLITETFDSAGGQHFTAHHNFQDVSGVDLVTGAKYHLSDTSDSQFKFTASGTHVETVSVNVHMIGQGSAPNFLMSFLLHITVNPNGTITAFVDNITSECK